MIKLYQPETGTTLMKCLCSNEFVGPFAELGAAAVCCTDRAPASITLLVKALKQISQCTY